MESTGEYGTNYNTSQVVIALEVNGSSGDIELEKAIAGIFAECFDLWKSKHHDYGRGNISKFGEKGILVRDSDKIERLINLLFNNPRTEPSFESIEDSWKDTVNYGAMALLCRRGLWK